VVGPVPGIIGTLQAQEAIKLVLQLPTIAGRLLIFDGLQCKFRTVGLRGKVMSCAACSQAGMLNPHEFDYPSFVNADA